MTDLERAEYLIDESRKTLRQLSKLFEQTQPIYGWDSPYGPRTSGVVGDLCSRLDKWIDERKQAATEGTGG